MATVAGEHQTLLGRLATNYLTWKVQALPAAVAIMSLVISF